MGATQDREFFPFMIAIVLTFLTITYISFALLCYYTFGSSLDRPLIIEMMPSSNIIIIIVKILYIINLVFSYPLIIYMTNIILEGFMFKSWKKATNARKYCKNLSRSMVLLLGIIAAMYLKDMLDKVLALCGTLLGSTVVMTIPALCHYKLLAKTRR